MGDLVSAVGGRDLRRAQGLRDLKRSDTRDDGRTVPDRRHPAQDHRDEQRDEEQGEDRQYEDHADFADRHPSPLDSMLEIVPLANWDKS